MGSAITFLLAFLLLPWPLVAQDTTATLLDGTIWVIRGATMLQCVEGMKLRPGASWRVRLLDSRSWSSVGAPSQRSDLPAGCLRAAANGGDFVLLSGWLKGETSSKGGAFRYNTTLLGAGTKDGTFVLHSSPGGAEIFVESGSGTIAEMSSQGSTGHAVSVRSGQFLTRKSGKNVATGPRPDAAFLESMPQAFRDTLPSRLSKFQGKKPPAPRADHEVSYAEVQPWLTIGQAWRGGFVERFKPRLKDPDFRRAVEDHLTDHPEWIDSAPREVP